MAVILCVKMDQSLCVQLQQCPCFLCLRPPLLEGDDLQCTDPPQFSHPRELLGIISPQSDMLNISLQLFLGASALHHLCLSVPSAVVCRNCALRVRVQTPPDYVKTRSLSQRCVLLRDAAYGLPGTSRHSSSHPCARACGKTKQSYASLSASCRLFKFPLHNQSST